MKRRGIAAVLALVMTIGVGVGSATAANSIRPGAAALNVGVLDDFIIAGKYFVANDLALLAGFGLGIKGGDAAGTDLGVILGIRKYLSVNDFAPFAGGRFTYSSTREGDAVDYGLMGEFGAEYFLYKQFSIEGSAGVGFTSEKRTFSPTDTSTTETTFGTRRFGVSFNFYF